MMLVYSVFPAHAGMSPCVSAWNGIKAGFPRSRGDEPRLYDMAKAVEAFSPLTRG